MPCSSCSLFYVLYFSVADPHHFDADPDPAFHFDADPDLDPTLHVDADPDPTFYFDADPDPTSLFDTDPDPPRLQNELLRLLGELPVLNCGLPQL